MTSQSHDAEVASESGTLIVEFITVPVEGMESSLPVEDAVQLQLPVHSVSRPAAEMNSIPVPWRHPLRSAAWLFRAGFGIVSLIMLLALLAAIPIVNVLVLGYLLEVEGRVARSGRLRQAFPLLGRAPQLGAMVLGTWLWILPLRLLSDTLADARLIDPTSNATRNLGVVLPIAAVLVAVHLILALARGGSLSTFFRPIKNFRWLLARIREGNYLSRAATAIREFIADLQLRHHFWIGIRGLFGAALWLFIPTALFGVVDRTEGGPILVTLFGGFCLLLVFLWLPFLQARFAAEDRFRAFFELGKVRKLFNRAPIAWLVATLVVYTLALPLYLLKIALVPRDAMWFITIVFIASIYPARVITGWAYSRALRAGTDAWFGWRWMSRLLIVPLVGSYVFLLFFTQLIGAHGKGVLFEHHAFLLPVPF